MDGETDIIYKLVEIIFLSKVLGEVMAGDLQTSRNYISFKANKEETQRNLYKLFLHPHQTETHM